MSVRTQPPEHRTVSVEIEVPGSPEDVWEAIATGPGISSWFVPTELDGREGGSLVCRFGPGMESRATITAWEPPHRFAAESADLGPDAPPLETEWTVEPDPDPPEHGALVRVVHRVAAGRRDDWDGLLESAEAGWPGWFRILRLYLTHFRGQRCTPVALLATTEASPDTAWEALTAGLGLGGANVGERRSAPEGAPSFAGEVVATGESPFPHHLLLLLDEPARGIASLGAQSMGGQTTVPVHLYLYGEEGARAAGEEPAWRRWLDERLAAAGRPPGGG